MTDQKSTDVFTFEDIKTIAMLAYDCLMALEYYELSASEAAMIVNELGLSGHDVSTKATAALVAMTKLKAKVEEKLSGEPRQRFIERVYLHTAKSYLKTRNDEMIAEQKG